MPKEKNATAEPTDRAKEEQKKKCFVIMPVGDDGSSTRRASEGVLDSAIKPVLENLGFEVIPPHRMSKPGSITDQVIQNLLEDDLVVANLMGLNPNVMYELAVRHATCLPIVVIADDDTDLPFDVAGERALFYTDDMMGVEQLKTKLKVLVEAAMKDKDPDNPIYRVARKPVLKDISPDEPQEYLIRKLDQLQSAVDRLASSPSLLPRSHSRPGARGVNASITYRGTEEDGFNIAEKSDGTPLSLDRLSDGSYQLRVAGCGAGRLYEAAQELGIEVLCGRESARG